MNPSATRLPIPPAAGLEPDGYALLDSGAGRKLERFGPRVLSRPAAQAVWKPRLPEPAWAAATARFDREEGQRWEGREHLEDGWNVRIEGLCFHLAATDFGHLGVFPEQRSLWRWLRSEIPAARPAAGRRLNLLNLFAYSGGSTLAAAAAGAAVCHLDASQGMVDWARRNAAANGLADAPVRWVVDDALKFLKREARRGRRYDGILLDPPSFGRGRRGEVFKIQDHLPGLLEACRAVCADPPALFLLTCHTPEFSPLALRHLVDQTLAGFEGRLEEGEMTLEGGPDVLPLPSGAYARWSAGAAPGRERPA